LSDLDRHLAEADIVISATASRTPILHRAQVEQALRQRRHRPMLLLDLAVPRDIDPAVSGLRDVFLYTVDDLQRAIEDNRRNRREAAAQAEAIIDVQTTRFMENWQASQRQQPLLQLRAHGEAARAAALAKARQQLAAGLPPEQALELLAHTLTNRLLHAPTVALREAARNGDDTLAQAALRLFPAHDGSDTTPPNAP
jgi:glutamyl-tRNA reductase